LVYLFLTSEAKVSKSKSKSKLDPSLQKDYFGALIEMWTMENLKANDLETKYGLGEQNLACLITQIWGQVSYFYDLVF
jgi:hypothetical protein